MPPLFAMGKGPRGAETSHFNAALRKDALASFIWHACFQVTEASGSKRHFCSSSLLCSSFHSLVIDVTMALDTLSLPVLEPLNPSRLQDVTVLSLSCLYAGETLLWLVSFS